MGNALETSSPLYPFTLPHKRGEPHSQYESKYDPLYGFPRGRRKRESPMNYAELESARIPYKYRDYCAHFYAKREACMRDNYPLWWRCDGVKEDWDQCQYNDLILRMKEYERERRLDRRNRRILAQMAKEENASVGA